MKKVILSALFLVLILICTVFASACDGGGEEPISTNAETDDVTSPPKDEEITEEDAKLEALRILTPRASDKTPIADGKVHCYRNGHGNKIIRDVLEETLGKKAKPNIRFAGLGQLYLMLHTEKDDETPETMCNIEGCKHDDITCPAIVGEVGLVLPVTDEKTGRTVVYTELNVNVKSIPVHGKRVDLSKEFGFPENVSSSREQELHVLFEYDLETGERRAVTTDNFFTETMFVNDYEYYNGRLYFSLFGQVLSQSEGFDKHPRLLYVDVANGEVKYCEESDGEQSFLYFSGIHEDKVYCLSETGEVIKMNLDFDEREVIGKIDNFVTELKNPNGSGSQFVIYNRFFAFIDEYLYVETPDSELNNYVLYKIPLSGEGEPEMIPDKLLEDLGYYEKDEPEGVDYFYFLLRRILFRTGIKNLKGANEP